MNLGRFDRKNREANEEAADIQKEVVHGVLSIVEEGDTVRVDLSGKLMLQTMNPFRQPVLNYWRKIP